MPQIVLASTSPYRKALLERLGLPFITHSPNIDETHLPNEAPIELVQRLAQQKARVVANNYPNAIIIGSDQVATLGDVIIGKPGNHKAARAQLQQSSGKAVTFLTGLTVINTATGDEHTIVEPFTVRFRELTDAEIESYLLKEQPYDCAGSFKSEGLGVALFEEMRGNDPTSLIGLPLIQLTTLLKKVGVFIL